MNGCQLKPKPPSRDQATGADANVVETEREQNRMRYNTVCSPGRQRRCRASHTEARLFTLYLLSCTSVVFVLSISCWELHALGCKVCSIVYFSTYFFLNFNSCI